MATSVGQYAPVFLPGEPTFLTEAWQATVYRVAKSRTLLKQARARRHETSFACDSSASVRIEHEGGAAAWLAGTMAALSMQGHRLPPPQDPARVFLQGFEGPYGWERGSLTAAKQGTSLQSAAPSGVAHPPTWRGPVGLRTGWLGNQQLSFPQPGKDRRGAEDGEGPRCPGPPPLTGGCRVPPGH